MISKVHLMLLVVLCVVGSALCAGCPRQKIIYPCSCSRYDDELSLFCDDLNSLDELKRILSACNTKYTLDVTMYYSNLGLVPTDFFKGFNIRTLEFSNCDFDPIPDEEGRVFVGLEDTLEELTVIKTISKRNSPSKLDLSHLHNLTSLRFAENTIPEMSDDWFKKGPSSLTHVYLINNRIKKLGNNVFANLPNLMELWLNGNKFGGLNRSMLPNPATYLDNLILSYNWLESVPEDFFSDMPVLKDLALDMNNIQTLPQETFGTIWNQLESIDLEGNAMNCEDSVLEWIINSNHTPAITATCGRPNDREGRQMWDVIKENQ